MVDGDEDHSRREQDCYDERSVDLGGGGEDNEAESHPGKGDEDDLGKIQFSSHNIFSD